MDDAKLLEALRLDLRTGGHLLCEEIAKWKDDEVVALHNTLDHWSYVVSKDLTRRAINQADI